MLFGQHRISSYMGKKCHAVRKTLGRGEVLCAPPPPYIKGVTQDTINANGKGQSGACSTGVGCLAKWRGGVRVFESTT